MIRRSGVALAILALLLPIAPAPAGADHTPLNSDGSRWRTDAANDFNLDLVWTQGYAAQGTAFQQRVRDVVARDPSCFAGICTFASYARWYLHQAQPYFGGAESTVADFDPRSGPATSRCGTLGSVSFHWLSPSQPNFLGETYRCPYGTDPTRVFSSQVLVNPNPPAPGTSDVAAYRCGPGSYTWFTAGPGDANNDAPLCRTYDLMSVLAHEVGHVLGFGDYRTDAFGANSVDPVCLNGSETEDPRLGKNTNRETMCIPVFAGSERQRTPEEHEKAAFATLYPPTGPAPTVSPTTQTVNSGAATWAVSVPRDPARATSFHMIYGDGTYDTRAVPQGTGWATYAISHTFGSTGAYSQMARVVETGGQSTSATVNNGSAANTNLVGQMKAYGDRTDTATVTVTGSQSDGQYFEDMTQSVSSGVAKADNESNGFVQLWTGPRSDNGWRLAAGIYDVNWINVGYDNHTTWRNPSGDCMHWTVGSDAKNLGTVVINTAGNITAGAGAFYVSYASNWVKFDLPTANANTSTEESAVCISDSGGYDGNMVPLKLI